MATAQGSGDVESDLFLSAAHGALENVQQLLSSGRVALTISLDISRPEFTAQVQQFVQQAVAEYLTSSTNMGKQGMLVTEQEVSIVAVSDQVPQPNGASGVGVLNTASVAVAISVKAAGGLDAEVVAKSLEQKAFLEQMGKFLLARIRTVNWNPKLAEKPTAVKYGVNDRDKIECTAMHWAALNDRVELIRWLYRHGAELSPSGNEGHTPLHWAALKGNLKAVIELVQCGADIDATDNWKFTPIVRASQNGHIMVVLELIQRGANLILCDDEKHNGLHWAVFHRHHVVVDWYLKSPQVKANINMQDQNGATALHLAAKKSGREMCRKLLEAGADTTVLDNEELTAEQVAKKQKREVNRSYLHFYSNCPRWLQRCLVVSGKNGRAFTVIPTSHGGMAIAFIALAYIYYAFYMVSISFGSQPTANMILLLFTPVMWWCYWKSWHGDPGTMSPEPEVLLKQLANDEIAMDDIIVSAMHQKTARAKFSRFFRCYVARFDHDCPWISNVVGASNIRAFVGFCVTCAICLFAWDYILFELMLANAKIGTQVLCESGKKSPLHSHSRSGYGRIGCPDSGDYTWWILANEKINFLMLCIYIFFAIFTLVMSCVQTSQIARNITTNEVINWPRYKGWTREDGTFKNPYDRGILTNFKQFFTGYPSCPRDDTPVQGSPEYALLSSQDEGDIEMGRTDHLRHHNGHGHSHGGVPCQGHGRDQSEESEFDPETAKQLKDIGFDV